MDFEDYEIEKIVAHRFRNGRRECEIQWKNSWVPEGDINSDELLPDYWEKNMSSRHAKRAQQAQQKPAQLQKAEEKQRKKMEADERKKKKAEEEKRKKAKKKEEERKRMEKEEQKRKMAEEVKKRQMEELELQKSAKKAVEKRMPSPYSSPFSTQPQLKKARVETPKTPLTQTPLKKMQKLQYFSPAKDKYNKTMDTDDGDGSESQAKFFHLPEYAVATPYGGQPIRSRGPRKKKNGIAKHWRKNGHWTACNTLNYGAKS